MPTHAPTPAPSFRTGLLCSTALVAAFVAGSVAAQAQTLPQGGVVTGGAASIATSDKTMTITTGTDRTAIKWDSFNIGSGGKVTIRQPGSTSTTLNQVTGTNPSQIFGTLESNGRVIVANPNGVWFGPDSHVDVAAIVATTGRITDASASAFSAGGTLQIDAAPTNGAVVNDGTITVRDGGVAALVAPGVRNSGTITARVGTVKLASGTKATVDFYGDGLINLAVEGTVSGPVTGPDGKAANAGVENGGRILADGGRVVLSANVAKGVVDNVINMSGVIEARGVSTAGGVVELLGGDGSVAVSGTVNATGAAGKAGGKIVVQAGTPGATADGVLNLSGGLDASSADAAGGSVEVSARFALLGGTVRADGADGGRVSVRATGVTQSGTVSANGTTGAGGSVAISATSNITQTASAKTEAKGTGGAGGAVRLDGASGRVFSSGALSATGATGGTVTVLANDIALVAATLDASGTTAGGRVLVGGDLHGSGPATAATVYVNGATVLRADALTRGKGGDVVVWSDQHTTYYGSASARGGAQGGDGGLIEVSSATHLSFDGSGDASAAKGVAGTLLLDPKNIVIDDGAGGFAQFDLIDPNQGLGTGFGTSTFQQGNGTVVVSKPLDVVGGAADAGSVYFYNPTSGALVAAFQGSHAGDKVGSGSGSGDPYYDGIIFLNYANFKKWAVDWTLASQIKDGSSAFLIFSPNWNGNRGAVTWVAANGTVNGVVTSSNSLVGSSANDRVGADTYGYLRIRMFDNNNYLLLSSEWGSGKGAITFGTAAAGLTGVVGTANSLVGSLADNQQTNTLLDGDSLGSGDTVTLANGNMVVLSPLWNTTAGAVTFISKTGGIANSGAVGALSSANSLIGDRAGVVYTGTNKRSNPANQQFQAYYGGDQVGSSTSYIYTLTNGDYVVVSSNWDHGRGAVTLGSGSTGVIGTVSDTNSLVGDTRGVGTGATANGGVGTDGNGFTYFVNDYGNRGYYGGDQAGSGGVKALTGGGFVILSSAWGTNRGAVTYVAQGTTTLSGVISASNALFGTTVGSLGWDSDKNGSINNGDRVGTSVTALANGNYVIASTNWSSGAGAVTLVDGTTGHTVIGSTGNDGDLISATNSLVGSSGGDSIGSFVVTLTNSAFVTYSSSWGNSKGAVTRVDGATGIVGVVSSSNSLVGQTATQWGIVGGDNLGSGGVTLLPNGNWVLASPHWATDTGAVSFFTAGQTPTGFISATNSIVGSTAGVHDTYATSFGGATDQHAVFGGDAVGSGGIVVLSKTGGSNFLILSPDWGTNKGAVTFVNGTTGPGTGNIAVSSANSLVGGTAGVALVDRLQQSYYRGGDRLGGLGYALSLSPSLDLATSVNYYTSEGGTCYSSNCGIITLLANGNFLLATPQWSSNKGAITFGRGDGTFDGTNAFAGTISASNSLVGSTASVTVTRNDTGSTDHSQQYIDYSQGDRIGISDTMQTLSNGSILIGTGNWNGNRGAVIKLSNTAPTVGTISSSNALVGSTTDDRVGSGGIWMLSDNNYVIISHQWSANTGAVTHGTPTSAPVGTISASNSLVGATAGDAVGSGFITVLAGGQYIVNSPSWNGGAGAGTWSGTAGNVTGTVSTLNSFTGAETTSSLISLKLSDSSAMLFALPGENVSGRVTLAFTDPTGWVYARAAGNDLKIAPSLIVQALNSGTSLVFEASNDITVNSSILANASATASLSLSAGRSITVASGVSIDTGNGNLTLLANDSIAHGVIDAYRGSGTAVINLDSTSILSAGTGAISITLAADTGKTYHAAGDISLGTISAATVSVENLGSASGALSMGGDITATASGTSILLVTGGVFSNASASNTLDAGAGRWLIYSADPRNNTLNGLTATGKYYNQTFSGNPPASQAATGNYLLYSVQPTLTVTGNGSVGYGAALGGMTPTIIGYIDGDTAATAVTGAASFSSAYTPGDAVGSSRAVTVSAGTLASPLGYALSFVDGTVSVTARTLTIALTGTVSKEYSGTTAATLAAGNYQITGLFGSDTFTVTKTSGTYGQSNVGSGLSVSTTLASGDFTAGGATVLSNYVLPTGALSGAVGEITPKTLTAALTGTTSKTYDGTTAATLAAGNYQLTGLVSGESITVGKTSGTYGQSNVGSGLSVGTTLASGDFTAGSGTALANYTLPTTASGAIGTINAKTLSVALTGTVSKAYDGTTTATLDTTNYSLTGVVAGESISVTKTSGTYAQSAKGTGLSVSTTLASGDFSAGGGTSLSNYVLPTGSVSGTIGAITGPQLTAILIGTISKTYDATTGATLVSSNYQISGLLNGDQITVTKTTGTFQSANVGSGLSISTTLVSGDFTAVGSTDLSNYVLPTTASGLIGTITAKALSAALTGTVGKVYDGTTAATLSAVNYQLTGLLSGQSISVGQTAGSYGSANVGSGLSVSTTLAAGDFTAGAGTLLSNYTLPTTASGTVGAITAKALSVALAGPVTKTYDGSTAATLAAANFQVSGLVNGESLSVTQTAGTFGSVNAGSALTVSTTLASGDFAAGSGTLLSNYTLPTGLVSGAVGAISPKALSASLTGSTSKVYDGTSAVTLAAGNFALSGLVGGDSLSVTKTSGTSGSVNAGTTVNVSTTLAAGDFTAGAGTLLSNYTLPTTASGAIGAITPKVLSVALAGPVAKTYDGSTTATLTTSNFQLTGLVEGESLSVTKTSGTFDGRNAGAALTVSTTLSADDFAAAGGALLGNYTLPTGLVSGAVGTINQRPLTVTLLGPVSKVSDGSSSVPLSAANFAVSGLALGETISLNAMTGTLSSSSPGTGLPVSATLSLASYLAGLGTDLANYALPTGVITAPVGTLTAAPTTIPLAQLIIPTTTTVTFSSPVTAGGIVVFNIGQSSAFLPSTGGISISGGASGAPTSTGGGAGSGGNIVTIGGSSGSSGGTVVGGSTTTGQGSSGGTGTGTGVVAGTSGGDINPLFSSGALLGGTGSTQNVHDFANGYLASIALGGRN